MQVSAKTLLGLIVVRNDALTKAVSAALGGNFERADYTLTQADADNIMAHLDVQHTGNDRSMPTEEFAAIFGKTPREMQYEAATEINQAVQHAARLINMAGLETESPEFPA